MKTRSSNFSFDYTIIWIAILVLAMYKLPYFGALQYPFKLLGTWFHEMGHGLTALLVGGDFQHLEIYSNGGGVAYTNTTQSYLPSAIARALIAAGGLLGPAIAGGLCIVAARNHKTTVWALRILIGIMMISLLIWIRSLWGIVTISSFGVLFLYISCLKNRKIERITLLFIGIQCWVSTYGQLDYLFTKQFERDGRVLNSDTQNIAENLIGPYWFWAFIIVCISVVIIWKSLNYYLKKQS